MLDVDWQLCGVRVSHKGEAEYHGAGSSHESHAIVNNTSEDPVIRHKWEGNEEDKDTNDDANHELSNSCTNIRPIIHDSQESTWTGQAFEILD